MLYNKAPAFYKFMMKFCKGLHLLKPISSSHIKDFTGTIIINELQLKCSEDYNEFNIKSISINWAF